MTGQALDIYQTFLDEMGAAVLAADSDAFAARIFLPHVIETENFRVLLESRENVVRQFHGFCRALRGHGVDAYIRIARRARFDGPDRIEGEHETFLMSGSSLVVPRFSNTASLEWRGDIWGCTVSRHHARYIAWPDLLPRVNT